MSDDKSADLIFKIQLLADAIVKKSNSCTKPAKFDEFDELVGAYYVVLKGVATELNITENVNDNNNPHVESIQTLTEKIVAKLKSGENLKLSNDNLSKLLNFFNTYHATICDNIDDVINVENEIHETENEDAAPSDNPIKLMVHTNNTKNRIAIGFISENEPNDTKIFDTSFVKINNYYNYKTHWFLDIANSKKKDMISFFQKALTENKNANSVTIGDIEYEIVGMEYLKNTGAKGGRRRTRKNKRRITKRKLNKNKNKGKTKKHK